MISFNFVNITFIVVIVSLEDEEIILKSSVRQKGVIRKIEILSREAASVC